MTTDEIEKALQQILQNQQNQQARLDNLEKARAHPQQPAQPSWFKQKLNSLGRGGYTLGKWSLVGVGIFLGYQNWDTLKETGPVRAVTESTPVRYVTKDVPGRAYNETYGDPASGPQATWQKGLELVLRTVIGVPASDALAISKDYFAEQGKKVKEERPQQPEAGTQTDEEPAATAQGRQSAEKKVASTPAPEREVTRTNFCVPRDDMPPGVNGLVIRAEMERLVKNNPLHGVTVFFGRSSKGQTPPVLKDVQPEPGTICGSSNSREHWTATKDAVGTVTISKGTPGGPS